MVATWSSCHYGHDTHERLWADIILGVVHYVNVYVGLSAVRHQSGLKCPLLKPRVQNKGRVTNMLYLTLRSDDAMHSLVLDSCKFLIRRNRRE